jgi:hypothetical protein
MTGAVRFSDPAQADVYRLYIDVNPPASRNGLLTAYRRGLADKGPIPDRTSLAYAAWSAGRDKRRWSAAVRRAAERRERE